MEQPERPSDSPSDTPPPSPPPIASPPIVSSTAGQQQDWAEPKPALDDHGDIAEDVQCRMCSYNLRGLSPDACCPECATPAGLSIHGDLLQYANPRWVKQLAGGALWLIVTFFLGIALGLAGGALDELTSTAIFSAIAELITSAVGLVALWKLTQPGPDRIEEIPILNVRQMIRLLAVVGFAAEAMASAPRLQIMGAGLSNRISLLVSVVLMLSWMTGKILLLILLRRFALRIPNVRLACQTKIVMWGFVPCYAVLIASGIVMPVLLLMLPFAWSALTISSCLVPGIGDFIGFPIFVFEIWLVILLFRYHAAFGRLVRTSLTTWIQHVPGAS